MKNGMSLEELLNEVKRQGANKRDFIASTQEDVRMVELSCEPAEDGMSMVLVRRVSRYLLATRVEEPEPEVICRGVRELDLKYHDGIDWQDSWDAATRDNTLPLAVGVTMELIAEDATEGGEDGYAVTRVLPVACGAIPEEGARAETVP